VDEFVSHLLTNLSHSPQISQFTDSYRRTQDGYRTQFEIMFGRKARRARRMGKEDDRTENSKAWA